MRPLQAPPAPMEPANKPDLRPVAGLRALACLGILSTHCAYWTLMASADRRQVYRWLDESKLTAAMLSIGEPAVELFIILSGFLAAWTLVPALESARDTPALLLSYYRKRVARIVPNLYSVLLLVAGVVIPLGASGWLNPEAQRAFFSEVPWDLGQCPRQLWAAFAFVNNRLPMGGCASVTWSLAVTMQLYALFPLGLVALRPKHPHFRARVALVAALVWALAVLQRAHLVVALRLWERMPIALLGPHEHPQTWETLDTLSKATYLSTFNRSAAFALGTLAALAVHTPSARAALARWRGAAFAALCLLGALVLGSQTENKAGAEPDPHHLLAKPETVIGGFVVLAGVLQPLAGALLTALAAANLPGPSAPLRAVLASRPLARLAALSYDVYLLHPLVLLALFAVAPPSGWYTPRGAPVLLGVLALVAAASALAAHWHGLLCAGAVDWLGRLLGGTKPRKAAPHVPRNGAKAASSYTNGVRLAPPGRPPLCPSRSD